YGEHLVFVERRSEALSLCGVKGELNPAGYRPSAKPSHVERSRVAVAGVVLANPIRRGFDARVGSFERWFGQILQKASHAVHGVARRTAGGSQALDRGE